MLFFHRYLPYSYLFLSVCVVMAWGAVSPDAILPEIDEDSSTVVSVPSVDPASPAPTDSSIIHAANTATADTAISSIRQYPSLVSTAQINLSLMRIVHSTVGGGFEAGSIEYFYNGTWYQTYGGKIGVAAFLTPHITLDFSLNGGIWHNMQTMKGGYASGSSLSRIKSSWFNFSGQYAFGEPSRPALSLSAGYFSFGYTSDIRNLGGYLFRSLPYPAVVYSGGSSESFLGIRLHSSFVPHLKQDLLVWSEIFYPYGDISLGYVADAALIKNGLHLGGGIVAHRLLPADPAITHGSNTRYPILDDSSRTASYSFAGTKLMARFCADIKKLAGLESRRLSAADLQLYGEVAVLGLKDYPVKRTEPTVGYPTIRERIPVMAGFRIPTFRILDELSLEIEYFNNPYRNLRPPEGQEPFPDIYTELSIDPTDTTQLLETSNTNYHKDDLKWSVSASRTLFEHVTVSLVIASDHLRIRDELGHPMIHELLRATDEWYWRFGVNFSF